jgi:hypothetical protein
MSSYTATIRWSAKPAKTIAKASTAARSFSSLRAKRSNPVLFWIAASPLRGSSQ